MSSRLLPLALGLGIFGFASGVAAESDPWADEAGTVLDDDNAPESDRGGPIDFTESPLAPLLLAAGATVAGSIFYAAVSTWALISLGRGAPSTAVVLLFVSFFAAPILPSVLGAVAVFAVRPWWEALLTGGAALAGGTVGMITGMALFSLVGPLLADPWLSIWFAGLFLPLACTIVAATVTAGLVPIGVEWLAANTHLDFRATNLTSTTPAWQE